MAVAQWFSVCRAVCSPENDSCPWPGMARTKHRMWAKAVECPRCWLSHLQLLIHVQIAHRLLEFTLQFCFTHSLFDKC